MRIVLLSNPHLCSPYFFQLIHLRTSCYSPINGYPVHFFPLSQIDFYSNHYLIFEGTRLLAAYRCFNTSSSHRGPLVKLATQYGTPRVKQKMVEVLAKHPLMSYQSQFVIRPELSGTQTSILIKELITAINWYEYLNNNQRPVIGASVKKFKTERIFRQWGYPPLEDQEGVLGYFEKPGSAQEIQLVFGSPSSMTKACYEKHLEKFKYLEFIGEDEQRAA